MSLTDRSVGRAALEVRTHLSVTTMSHDVSHGVQRLTAVVLLTGSCCQLFFLFCSLSLIVTVANGEEREDMFVASSNKSVR